MHGLILAELQRYIETNVGPWSWQEACRRAGVGRTSYTIWDTYPDTDLPALVQAGSGVTGVPVPAMLEDFGAFMVPALMRVCARHVPDGWSAMDLLADTERPLQLATRLTGRSVTVPLLRAERVSPRAVRIIYGSPRRMCGLARGIVRGILAHYREIGAIRETACMHDGAPHCEILVTRLAS